MQMRAFLHCSLVVYKRGMRFHVLTAAVLLSGSVFCRAATAEDEPFELSDGLEVTVKTAADICVALIHHGSPPRRGDGQRGRQPGRSGTSNFNGR